MQCLRFYNALLLHIYEWKVSQQVFFVLSLSLKIPVSLSTTFSALSWTLLSVFTIISYQVSAFIIIHIQLKVAMSLLCVFPSLVEYKHAFQVLYQGGLDSFTVCPRGPCSFALLSPLCVSHLDSTFFMHHHLHVVWGNMQDLL